MELNDAELLQRFVDSRDESAFSELVRRHLPLVYRAALRQLNGDATAAADAAQIVFTALARKSQRLTAHRSVAGWLYSSVHYATAQFVRTEARRRRREAIAEAMKENLTPHYAWEKLAPVIDELLARLKPLDRDAIILRFFENKSFEEIGTALELSADAARVRVGRALEKLQPPLQRLGIRSTATALALVLAEEAAQAAPSGLASTIVQNAAAAASTATATTLLAMSLGKIKLAALAVVLAGAAVTVFVQHRANVRLTEQLTQARASVASHQAPSTSGDVNQTSPHSAASTRAFSRADDRDSAEPARSSAPDSAGASSRGMVPIDSLGNQGFSTPRAAFATQLWAARGGDIALEAKALVLGPKARAAYQAQEGNLPATVRAQYHTPEEVMALALAGSPRPVQSMQVLDETQEDADHAVLHVAWQHEDSSEVITNDVHFHRDADGWKMIVPPSLVYRALGYLSAGATHPVSSTAASH